MLSQEAVQRALDNRTVIPAFNIPYLPMVQPVIQAIIDENSLAMIQVARLEWEKFESQSPEAVAEEYFRHNKEGYTLLHLDHVPVIDEDNQRVDFLPLLERALKAGYQSVMVDGSRLPLEENIAVTRQAAEAAKYGAALEAELGAVTGHEGSGIALGYEELFRTKNRHIRKFTGNAMNSSSFCVPFIWNSIKRRKVFYETGSHVWRRKHWPRLYRSSFQPIRL